MDFTGVSEGFGFEKCQVVAQTTIRLATKLGSDMQPFKPAVVLHFGLKPYLMSCPLIFC